MKTIQKFTPCLGALVANLCFGYKSVFYRLFAGLKIQPVTIASGSPGGSVGDPAVTVPESFSGTITIMRASPVRHNLG